MIYILFKNYIFVTYKTNMYNPQDFVLNVN